MRATSVLTPFIWLSIAASSFAQFGPQFREAAQLDMDGKGPEARQLLQKAIDSASSPQERANAQRAVAMSWAFEGNCPKAAEYEQKVIDYWKTQEQANPRNAFYQEGEMADEAARVCIDAGDLDAAAKWYTTGRDLGLKEPDISPERKALWNFRWEHAQARIAARRGDRTAAQQHIASAKTALDQMTDLRGQQEPFLPYLTGYVAFYLGEYQTALGDLQKANTSDPFIQCLLGQTYEKLGEHEKALACYRKAAATNGHNPPAAYAIPFARRKIG